MSWKPYSYYHGIGHSNNRGITTLTHIWYLQARVWKLFAMYTYSICLFMSWITSYHSINDRLFSFDPLRAKQKPKDQTKPTSDCCFMNILSSKQLEWEFIRLAFDCPWVKIKKICNKMFIKAPRVHHEIKREIYSGKITIQTKRGNDNTKPQPPQKVQISQEVVSVGAAMLLTSWW